MQFDSGHPLADCGTRFDWADREGQTLYDALDAFASSGAYQIRIENQGECWTATFCRLIDERDEAVQLGNVARLFGNYLDHVRAALNYLTYQFALLAIGKDPSLQGTLKPEAVEFPIFNDPALFRTHNRIKKLPYQYRRVFEQVQPYNTGLSGLWLLHELGREYRHRVLHAVAAWPASEFHGVFVNGRAITDIEITYDDGPLEHGTEVFRWVMPDWADGDTNVDPQVAIAVGLSHPLVRGRQCMPIINDIGHAGWNAVLDLLPSFA